MTKLNTVPESKYCTLQPLGDGIFAALNMQGNSGIIDLGELCLAFDTCITPSAAEELKQLAPQLTGHDTDIVINSHYHNDHTWGNQAFGPPVHIIASDRTYQLMLTEGKKELEDATANSAHTLAHFREKYQKVETEDQRFEAQMFIEFYGGIVQDLPRLSVRLPDITYKERLTLHGTKRSAELISFDNCHTGNDAVLFLPEDGIVFMGDLLFVGCHPYLGEGDPVNLIEAIKKIKDYQATRFVPGHGPVGTKADLDLIIEYIESSVATAQDLVKRGRTDKESIDALRVPERFRRWQLPSFYQSNLRALGKRCRTC